MYRAQQPVQPRRVHNESYMTNTSLGLQKQSNVNSRMEMRGNSSEKVIKENNVRGSMIQSTTEGMSQSVGV